MPLRIRQRTFPLFERLGFHVLPTRFNQPIPDTRTLDASLWSKRSALVGIDLNEPGQLALLSTLTARFKTEWDRFPLERTTPNHRYYVNNRIFESVDGEILYGMVRHVKPRRIIEVGSGFSTLLFAEAIAANRAQDPTYTCELVAIEPHPTAIVRNATGIARLIEDEVQHVPLSTFAGLQSNDFLFIDSSHVLRIGSDVQYECLEVLPRLAPGVIIHVHDIFFPSEYPRETILEGYQFPNEQYILQAFLSFNHAFEILWAASYMHLTHPDRLAAAFASYRQKARWPASLWLRRAGA